MMKILVVDDDPAMLMVATMALEEVGGFEVIQANGGREAIECARQKRPDAILMDLFMNDLDGPDVLEILRAHESTLSIPVIFHTAKSDPSDVRDLLALGAKGVIGKPFNPVDLAGEISKILSS
jgi:CheY-like chemotaxis protein